MMVMKMLPKEIIILCAHSMITETISLALNGGKVVSVTSPDFAKMYFRVSGSVVPNPWIGSLGTTCLE